MKELNHNKWELNGLAEIRWEHSDDFLTGVCHTIVYSGQHTYHQHGMAFIVRKDP